MPLGATWNGIQCSRLSSQYFYKLFVQHNGRIFVDCGSAHLTQKSAHSVIRTEKHNAFMMRT